MLKKLINNKILKPSLLFSSAVQFSSDAPTLEQRGGLKEYSVVYTDRAYNLMSQPFVQGMQDIMTELNSVYKSEKTIVLPGSGSFAMEAVARQFGTGKKCMVIRNGLFSYRWTQIFEFGNIPSEHTVLKAQPTSSEQNPQYEPMPIDQVVAAIKKEKPEVFFAPHIETSIGIILPDDYIKAISDAVHEVGGIFVLDGIASGSIWTSMEKLGHDVYITAPQKGWSSPACAGIVCLNKRALSVMENTNSSSFVLDLRKWLQVTEQYEQGKFLYHCTPPTDSLMVFRDNIMETKKKGYQNVNDSLLDIGTKTRKALESFGVKTVAAPGYQSPSVIVGYTDIQDVVPKFKKAGIQVAAGVPWFIDEKPSNTFRIGLFGLDKWSNVDDKVSELKDAMDLVSKL